MKFQSQGLGSRKHLAEPVNEQPPKSFPNAASDPALTCVSSALWFVCSVAGESLARLDKAL